MAFGENITCALSASNCEKTWPPLTLGPLLADNLG